MIVLLVEVSSGREGKNSNYTPEKFRTCRSSLTPIKMRASSVERVGPNFVMPILRSHSVERRRWSRHRLPSAQMIPGKKTERNKITDKAKGASSFFFLSVDSAVYSFFPELVHFWPRKVQRPVSHTFLTAPHDAIPGIAVQTFNHPASSLYRELKTSTGNSAHNWPPFRVSGMLR